MALTKKVTPEINTTRCRQKSLLQVKTDTPITVLGIYYLANTALLCKLDMP